MELSKRLLSCASMVRTGTVICDVGSDHGYLPCYLAQKGLVSYAVAIELNQQPLERTKQTIQACHLEHKVQVIQANGLQHHGLEQVEDIVIAGMGSRLISTILLNSFIETTRDKRYILQPMSRIDELRTFLYQQGYEILKEQAVVEQHHYYSVLCCRFCGKSKTISKLKSLVGRLPDCLDESAILYLNHQAQRMQRIGEGLRQSKQATSLAELAEEYETLAKEIIKLL